MVGKINTLMNESAAANLLSTTRVINNTLESALEKGLESLKVISGYYENGEKLEKDQICSFCDSMGFDWIVLADEQGKGMGYAEDGF